MSLSNATFDGILSRPPSVRQAAVVAAFTVMAALVLATSLAVAV